MIIGNVYTFVELQELINHLDYGRRVFLRVFDIGNKCTALMTTFSDNFSDSYQSGDAVLFYADGDTTSSEDDSGFKLIEVIPI